MQVILKSLPVLTMLVVGSLYAEPTLAQSGSAGGSLAPLEPPTKQGKSVSGGEINAPASAAPKPRRSKSSIDGPRGGRTGSADRCKAVAGTWVYLPLKDRAVFTAGGRVSAPDKGQGGSWSCTDPTTGRIQVDWTVNLRMTDVLTLSADGSQMTGRNSMGFPLNVTRLGSAAASARSELPDQTLVEGRGSGQLWGALAGAASNRESNGGSAINRASVTEAKQAALADCRRELENPEACRIVHVFSNGCAYISYGWNEDEHRGGYAIAATEQGAVDKCTSLGFGCYMNGETANVTGGCIGR